MKRTLSSHFFNRKTELVAQELLGKVLVRKINGVKKSFIITEVEAYVGPHDLACHSAKGKTKRTEVMYMEAGTIYIYLIYGMYYMLNIVTEEKNYPAAILIRGIEGISGPGKITRELSITKELNGLMMSPQSGLWIEEGIKVTPKNIIRTPRIGVAYAGEVWANKKLRYILKTKTPL